MSLSEPTQNEVLEVLHNTVEKRWMSLLDKHEAYLSTLVEDDDNADAWLQEVENSYHDLQVRYVKVKSEKLDLRMPSHASSPLANTARRAPDRV